MKNILIITLLVFVLVSCEKDNTEKKVEYLVTNSQAYPSRIGVYYQNDSAVLVKKNIKLKSALDQWTYSFMAERGDLIYVSALDTVPLSFVNVRILVDGKVYKQDSKGNDNTKPVTVSGTVPY